MKKRIILLGMLCTLISCAIVDKPIKLAGDAVTSVIADIVGGRSGEIESENTKYKFSNVKITLEDSSAIITGKLYQSSGIRKNIELEIPCQDKDGNELGYALDSRDELKKNEKWDFSAEIGNSNVRTCKMSEAEISDEPVKEISDKIESEK